METISAQPWARTSSAFSGVLILLVVINGMLSLPMSRLLTQAKPARGTIVAMVGILASCQPIPVLIMLLPAAVTASASCSTSLQS
ncbi:hypothetical protein MnTg04_01059 [bacterium MnTg04]|nr:hypothetical protein MnTg04_01059 [bacterium MnTg04]